MLDGFLGSALFARGCSGTGGATQPCPACGGAARLLALRSPCRPDMLSVFVVLWFCGFVVDFCGSPIVASRLTSAVGILAEYENRFRILAKLGGHVMPYTTPPMHVDLPDLGGGSVRDFILSRKVLRGVLFDSKPLILRQNYISIILHDFQGIFLESFFMQLA